MKIAIRVDASIPMGIGHLRRCLSLAQALRRAGADCTFVVRDLGIDAAANVQAAGFAALCLPAALPAQQPLAGDAPAHAAWARVPQQQDAEETCALLAGETFDWIVVDSYSFDARWHVRARQLAHARIAVIDDIADRPLEADLLVDQNLAPDHRYKYGAHAASIPRLFGGPRFALLDQGYEQAAPHRVHREVRSIGVFVGGTDPWNGSAVAVRACRDVVRFAGPIEIATTSANPHLPALRACCAKDPTLTLLVDAPRLDTFFARHDLQIGAGGGAAWERCRVGAPTVAVALAHNQRASLAQLEACGAVAVVPSLDVRELGDAIARLIEDPHARAELSRRSQALVDGWGALRVALALAADTLCLRAATSEDCGRILDWRNAEATRRHFRNPSEIAPDAHRDWWSRCLADPSRRLLIATCGEVAVGVLRLDIAGRDAEVSLYLDPGLHGLGLGTALLRSGQRWAREHEPSLVRLAAAVLPANQASAAAFAAAGFTPAGTTQWQWEIRR